MRYIPKGHEPVKLREQRETPNTIYAAFNDLREALAQEQGYICAFCMRGLNIHGSKVNGRSPTTIAHLLARHPAGANDALLETRRIQGMTYRNMVLTCDGYTNGDVKHCDQQQVNADVTIPLFDKVEMARVSFSPSGQVRHPRFQDQIGYDDQHKGLLNLNAAALVARRRQRWLTLATELQKLGRWKEGELKKQIQTWDSKDTNGHLREDCQCVVSLLQQKLRQLQAAAKPQPRKPKY